MKEKAKKALAELEKVIDENDSEIIVRFIVSALYTILGVAYHGENRCRQVIKIFKEINVKSLDEISEIQKQTQQLH